jgi:hypothetical protein
MELISPKPLANGGLCLTWILIICIIWARNGCQPYDDLNTQILLLRDNDNLS